MKKYKLLKDLPGIPAGTIYRDDELGNLVRGHKFRPANNFEYLAGYTKRLHWFSEWFSEIPDYSFVKGGDVYKMPGNGCVLVKGGWAEWFIESELKSNYSTLAPQYSYESFSHAIKPENLVYRPGKNPWDTPEVDKLGWGPMEPTPKIKTEVSIKFNGMWEVYEDYPQQPSNLLGTFHNIEKAELFKAALEGK